MWVSTFGLFAEPMLTNKNMLHVEMIQNWVQEYLWNSEKKEAQNVTDTLSASAI